MKLFFRRIACTALAVVLGLSCCMLGAYADGEPTLPDGFITLFDLRKWDSASGTPVTYAEGDTPTRSDACALYFEYEIPQTGTIAAGTKYTFKVKAPLCKYVPFTISGADQHGTSLTVAKGGINASDTDGVSTTGWIEFTEDAVKAGFTSSGQTGNFFVGANFNESEIPNTGKQTLDIVVNGKTLDPAPSVNFSVDQIAGKVTVSKSGSVTSLTDHTITWTVTATPSLTNAAESENHLTAFTVTDHLPSGLTYVSATAARSTGDVSSCVTHTDTTVTYTASTANEPLTPVVMTIVTKFNPDTAAPSSSGKYSFTNTADSSISFPQYEKDASGKAVVSSTPATYDTSAHSGETATAVCEVAGATIDKAGELSGITTLHWKVKAKNPLGQANPYVTDTIDTKHLTLQVSTIKLNGSSITLDVKNTYDQNSGKLVVYLDASKSDDQTLEYDTTITTAASGDKYSNTADLHVGNPGWGIEKTYSFNPYTALLSKSGVYDPKTHSFTWTIKLKTKGLSLSDIKLTDCIGAEAGTSYDTEFPGLTQSYVDGSMSIQCGTASQKLTPAKAADTVFPAKEWRGKQLDAYPAATYEIDLSSLDSSLNANDATITYRTVLSDDCAKYWANNTGASPLTVPTAYGHNSVKLSTGSVSTPFAGSDAIAKSSMLAKAGTYDYTARAIHWTVTANQNQMKLTGASIQDDIPSGWTLDPDSIQLSQGSAAVSSFTKSIDGSKLTVQLPDTEAGQGVYTLKYDTKIDPALLLTAGELSVTNEAVLYDDQYQVNGQKVGVTANGTVKISNGILSKTGDSKRLLADHEIDWTMDINKNLATIDSNGILDLLPPGLSYADGSAKAYNLTIDAQGAAVLGSQISASDFSVVKNQDNSIAITLNGVTQLTGAYRFTFATKVSIPQDYSNTVRFIKSSSQDLSSSTSKVVSGSFSGGSATLQLGTIKIVKQSKTGEALSGAAFCIKDSSGNSLGTMITASDGTVSGKFLAGTYSITETQAPDGYVLDSTPQTAVVTVNETAAVTFTDTKADNTTSFSPAVKKAVTGNTIPSGTKFSFVLKPNGTAPMPADSVNSEETREITGAGTVQFGQILYSQAGTYNYLIQENNTGTTGMTYDAAQHTMTVTVTASASTGKLSAAVLYDGKSSSLTITNQYQTPSTPGGNTPSDPEAPTPKTPVTPPVTPATPQTPSTPTTPATPSTPTTPTKPPVLPRLPDPNDPASPKEVTVIGDDGVPTTYIKEEQPDGTYEYIPEDDTPTAQAPGTGDQLALWLALAGLSASGLAWIEIRARQKKRGSGN